MWEIAKSSSCHKRREARECSIDKRNRIFAETTGFGIGGMMLPVSRLCTGKGSGLTRVHFCINGCVLNRMIFLFLSSMLSL